MLRIIMAEGWHDAAFCAQHVADLDLLREAVEPFTVEYVSGIAGVTPRILREAADAFACTGTRGIATTGPGTALSPHSHLSAHRSEARMSGKSVSVRVELGSRHHIQK